MPLLYNSVNKTNVSKIRFHRVPVILVYHIPPWFSVCGLTCYQPLGKNSKVHHCVIFRCSQINVPLQDLARFGVRNIPRWLNVCLVQHKSMIKCFSWVCVSLYVHISVCCFCLQACVGVEQIHVIWVIDIFPPAESWLRCLMESRLKIHSFFYFCLLSKANKIISQEAFWEICLFDFLPTTV